MIQFKTPHIRILSLLAACLLMMMDAHTAAATASPTVWLQTSPMLSPRSGAGIITVNGSIYAIGGIDGKRFLNSSESSRIQEDGTLSPWRAGSTLNEERGFFGVAHHGGFVYAVGGGNGPGGHHLLRSVERAPLLADGQLGEWRTEPELLNLPRRCARVAVVGQWLYAFGGFGGTLLDSVERAPFQPDGSLGPWELVKEGLTLPRYIHAMTAAGNQLYILGGHTQEGGRGEAAVEFAPLAGGVPGAWKQVNPLINGRYGLAAANHGGYLYALGGMNGAAFLDVIERAAVDADGTPDAWQIITPLPVPLADFGAIVDRDRLYIIGGTNKNGYYNNVLISSFDGRGDLAAAGATDPSSSTPPPTPVNRVELPNGGTVVQALDGGTYIYIEVETDTGREWLAAAHANILAGDAIRYSDGIKMTDFYSKHLGRRFDVIRFVGNLEKVPGQTGD